MRKKLPPILFLVALALIPFKTTLVPEWKVQVVDENGNPHKGQLVRQFCDNYTLGVSPCSGTSGSLQLTDENGYVVFPERNIYMSPLLRLISPAFHYWLSRVAHGGYGVSIYLDSTSPQGLKTLKYIPGEPLSEKFILPSK